MMNIYEEIAACLQRGESCAVATIIACTGSAPRKDHAKMLIFQDGRSSGSIGGGCIEAEVWQIAMKSLNDGEARIQHFDLSSKDAAEGGLMCGGKLQVYIEPVLPSPRVIIFGGGHVSKSLVQICKLLGFLVSVVEDREAFANKGRFPEADQLIVGEYEKVLAELNVDSHAYILIATRGHEFDLQVTEWAVRTPARYVGLLGSRRKIAIIRKHLIETGVPKENLANLYAPVGLDIGSDTPEEIAISVAAELVMVRKNRGRPRVDWGQ
jgi:xanthine dehydrogenase accessory factor